MHSATQVGIFGRLNWGPIFCIFEKYCAMLNIVELSSVQAAPLFRWACVRIVPCVYILSLAILKMIYHETNRLLEVV